MTYEDFLHRLINDGIEAVKRDYAGDDDVSRFKRAGSIDGFMECRGKTPVQILELLEEARVKTREALGRVHEGEIRDQDYWKVRCKELEVEWVANCISVVLVNRGDPPIVPPTARAAMAVAKIVGVKER